MDRPRIALLDASHGHEATRRNFRREVDASLIEFDVTDGEIPDRFDVDGVIVTGSRASVYWEEPWIADTREYVRSVHDRGIPLFGICWGHQLIADALGGTVTPMGEYEIGYKTITQTGETPMFEGIDREFVAYTTHSDEVTAVPDGTAIVAENEVSIQAYAGDGVWGVQFHPEYDMETAREVTEAKDELDPAKKRTALDSITEDRFEEACHTKQVFDNFLVHLVAAPTRASD